MYELEKCEVIYQYEKKKMYDYNLNLVLLSFESSIY